MPSPIYSKITCDEIKQLLELKNILGLEYYVHGLFSATEDPERSGYNIKSLKETL